MIAHEVAHLVLGHHAGCMGSRHLLIEVPTPGPETPDPNFRLEEMLAAREADDELLRPQLAAHYACS